MFIRTVQLIFTFVSLKDYELDCLATSYSYLSVIVSVHVLLKLKLLKFTYYQQLWQLNKQSVLEWFWAIVP